MAHSYTQISWRFPFLNLLQPQWPSVLLPRYWFTAAEFSGDPDVGDNFADMERNALWFADETGFTVHIRHGIRVVHRYRSETGDLPPAEIRMQAAARAVEFALEYRVDLRQVSEAREWL